MILSLVQLASIVFNSLNYGNSPHDTITTVKTGLIHCGDCLVKLKSFPADCVDLIYIDPPFNSNRNYITEGNNDEKRQFRDRFESVAGYIAYMKPRLRELHRVLKPTGSFYYHCDWHASHYVKVLLDGEDLFGYGNFQNEIAWCYRSGGASPKRRFSRKHDIILFYSKTADYTFNGLREKSYNRGLKPYRFQGVREFEDEGGWYTDVGMKDYWEINMVGRTSRERLDYPTQKPEALLERIISASSNEGDIVLDAFCGSGTTLAMAQKLNREWIGIDISPAACKLATRRLHQLSL
ncbi:MAG: site-specific DNA-methyltransferase [Chloroflexi bacterium]|nr:site-specific DNA-methyltransferase [Chloroflexota bacterium]